MTYPSDLSFFHSFIFFNPEKLSKEECEVPHDWLFPFCESKIQVRYLADLTLSVCFLMLACTCRTD